MAKKEYLWVKDIADSKRVGLTKEGQEALGKVKFVDLPMIGKEISKGDSTGSVEAQKAVVELQSPVAGKIVTVNDKLNDDPELLNGSESDAWLFEVNE
ncbi:glycine cleavage system protein H [Companilactobacillus sp.]|jgi:glycine cleavage system H protein|uniref:glycine cleavage system protein H n=1 Tax=Companilactobacillus sp. TaxID=2767905 RepID=UPI0025C65642|nr:glycine cleavage system protein H [Companilactobacillus sp.]MCH4008471.1 glycine cleavage system protein H [Companilactobacillus sp.]MCH4051350.1 glycine cleavage system protein H [Companilactobacillus sp.]MCH4076414.1 glycine cleavage system protein H [Companilactobacillus sp.]MCH4124989.1 glycine cleavage system protein H [Companilactobacillus sp.]MCH4131531.1 glycine cleavage system protein H [Companilactobacillus sp.]